MNLFSLLFSFQGRIGRAHWWLGMAIVASSVTAPALGIGMLKMHPILFLPCALLATFPVFALGIKRLHDRDLTGWYIAWITVIPAMLLLLAVRVSAGSAIFWTLIASALLLAVWGLIELGLRPGTDGVNEYDGVADEATHAVVEF
jgi:uncharacterized membrane protein YhaH (DUF805 family)